MGFDIALQTERGEVIEAISDPRNVLHRVLERAMPDQPRLAEIDWYGDTIFNRLQMTRFLSEWQSAAKHCESAEEKELVNRVKALAQRCEDGVHLYLKFIGD